MLPKNEFNLKRQKHPSVSSFRHIPSPLPLPKPNVTALYRQNRGSSLYVYEK